MMINTKFFGRTRPIVANVPMFIVTEPSPSKATTLRS